MHKVIEFKLEKTKRWSKEGLLRYQQVQQILDISYSGVENLVTQGKLERIKAGPCGSRAPVWITLESLYAYIKSWIID